MQRSRGRMVPGVLEKQPGGPFSWSRESERERGRRGGQGGGGGRCSGHCGPQGGDWTLPTSHHKKGGDFLSSCPYGASKAMAPYVIFPPQARLAQALGLLVLSCQPCPLWVGRRSLPSGKDGRSPSACQARTPVKSVAPHPMSLGAGGVALPSRNLRDPSVSRGFRGC